MWAFIIGLFYLSLPNSIVLGEATIAALQRDWRHYTAVTTGCVFAYVSYTIGIIGLLGGLKWAMTTYAAYMGWVWLGVGFTLCGIAYWVYRQHITRGPNHQGSPMANLPPFKAFKESYIISVGFFSCLMSYTVGFIAAQEYGFLPEGALRWIAVPVILVSTSAFWVLWGGAVAIIGKRYFRDTQTIPSQKIERVAVGVTLLLAGAAFWHAAEAFGVF